MKNICFLLLLFVPTVCFPQNILSDSISLTIGPNVLPNENFNREIISTLKLFLNSKDSSLTENSYWNKSDFERYCNPYSDLDGIEAGRLGRYFYQPSLMEIIETDHVDKKVVKIAFVGHNAETNSNTIKAIYNVVATQKDSNIVFSMYMDYYTRNWKTFQENNILYRISPCRTMNYGEVSKQHKDEMKLCKFLNVNPLPITFYSCTSPKELFEVLGFDYHPNMYADTSGGWSRKVNIVISANNSEYYMHELSHIYLDNLFPNVNAFLNEGFATYIGGSGKFGYEWQRRRLSEFVEENPDFKFEQHIDDPYERLYYEHETPIPYVIGALVCERTLRLYGKEKLFELFRSKTGIWDTLSLAGLTRNNITGELLKTIRKLPE